MGVNIASAQTKSDQIQCIKQNLAIEVDLCSKNKGKTQWEITTIFKLCTLQIEELR